MLLAGHPTLRELHCYTISYIDPHATSSVVASDDDAADSEDSLEEQEGEEEEEGAEAEAQGEAEGGGGENGDVVDDDGRGDNACSSLDGGGRGGGRQVGREGSTAAARTEVSGEGGGTEEGADAASADSALFAQSDEPFDFCGPAAAEDMGAVVGSLTQLSALGELPQLRTLVIGEGEGLRRLSQIKQHEEVLRGWLAHWTAVTDLTIGMDSIWNGSGFGIVPVDIGRTLSMLAPHLGGSLRRLTVEPCIHMGASRAAEQALTCLTAFQRLESLVLGLSFQPLNYIDGRGTERMHTHKVTDESLERLLSPLGVLRPASLKHVIVRLPSATWREADWRDVCRVSFECMQRLMCAHRGLTIDYYTQDDLRRERDVEVYLYDAYGRD